MNFQKRRICVCDLSLLFAVMLPIGGDRGAPLTDFGEDVRHLGTPVPQALPSINQITPPGASMHSPTAAMRLVNPATLVAAASGNLPPILGMRLGIPQSALVDFVEPASPGGDQQYVIVIISPLLKFLQWGSG